MTSLFHLKTQNQNALDEIRALRKGISRQRTAVANAGLDAGGDPELTAHLTAQRVEALRELEDAALTALQDLTAIERETRAVLAGGLGVALTDAERAQAVELTTLYGEQTAEMPLPDLQAHLQAAVLHENRAAQFFWSQAARNRLAGSGPRFGTDTGDRGRDQAAEISRGALYRLVSDVDRTLRDRSADPVLEAADRLRDAAGDLRGAIGTARANRGEGPSFGDPRVRTVKVAGAPIYDPTGYQVAGYVDGFGA